VAENIGCTSRDLSIGSLFRVGNDAYASFKTHTHKVRYPSEPRAGVSAFVARRAHPGSGIARWWLRARTVCSSSKPEACVWNSEKIHLSVEPHHLEKAYNCISALLTDDTCPIDGFSVLNPDMMGVDVSGEAGAQLTMYVHDRVDPGRTRAFLIILGERLADADVQAGSLPSADSPLTGNRYLAFFSYRDEALVWRNGEVHFLQPKTDFYRSVCGLPRL
jgi:hypothetical protein